MPTGPEAALPSAAASVMAAPTAACTQPRVGEVSRYFGLLFDVLEPSFLVERFRHEDQAVNADVMLEAHRCLLAMNVLEVVHAKIKFRDAGCARLVAVAMALVRGLFDAGDGSQLVSVAFSVVCGHRHANAGRVEVWKSRVVLLRAALADLDDSTWRSLKFAIDDNESTIAANQRRVPIRGVLSICTPVSLCAATR